MLYFVSDNQKLKRLSTKANARLKGAFRPSTAKAYSVMFRTFVSFCVYMSIAVESIDVNGLLAFLECLKYNKTSVNMLANHLAAIRANFNVLGLNADILEDKRLKYYIKSIKLNRPVCVSTKNVISLEILHKIVHCCDTLYMGPIFKAVFLVAFFGFFRLSNLAPHSFSSFDVSRHLAAGDIFFCKKFVKILVKWTKTLQTHDQIKIISLPKLGKSPLCPYRALKAVLAMYSPSENQPLFQYKYACGWKPLIDSKIRKTLSLINVKLQFPTHFFTFHAFRRSGASLAFNANVPLQDIKVQGTWTSDCVWRYIQEDKTTQSLVSSTFQDMLAVA